MVDRPTTSKEKHGKNHLCTIEACNPDMTEVIKAAEVNEKSHTNCVEGPTGIGPKKDEPARNRLDTDDTTSPHCNGIHKAAKASEKTPAGRDTSHSNAPKWNDNCMTHNATH